MSTQHPIAIIKFCWDW
uniref:Uncharacterized protein n=1 Tax=Arundo donax TaxID=35708 RepID=A0A0A9BJJ1_ARUDO